MENPPRKPSPPPRKSLWPSFQSASFLTLALVGLLVSVLVPLPWEKHKIHYLERDLTVHEHTKDLTTDEYSRTTTYFTSQGTKCEAWLYHPRIPEGSRPPPVVIMAHGIGVQKDMALDMYAQQFAKAGMAVFLFDYRTYGGSDGTPRNWASAARFLEDWEAATEFVLSGGVGAAVDPTRVALWGVSFSGGHVLVTAAKFGTRIAAVVANEPFVAPNKALKQAFMERGPLVTGRLLAAGLSDVLRSLLGAPPIYLKLVGNRTELCLIEGKDSEYTPRLTANTLRQGGWKNLVLARVVFSTHSYRPIDHVHKIRCPVLFRVGLRDHLCPTENVWEARRKMQVLTEVIERNMTHLQAHHMGAQPQELAPVIAFLKNHLGLSGSLEAEEVGLKLEEEAQQAIAEDQG